MFGKGITLLRLTLNLSFILVLTVSCSFITCYTFIITVASSLEKKRFCFYEPALYSALEYTEYLQLAECCILEKLYGLCLSMKPLA